MDSSTLRLRTAPRNGDEEVIAILLTSDADAKARDKNGKRAIDHAEEKGNLRDTPTFRRFVIASLTPDTLPIASGAVDKRAFLRLCAEGRLEDVECAIQNGADVNAAYGGTTPLSLAAALRKPDIVAALLKSGADVNVKNAWGSTALLEAIEHEKKNSSWGSPEEAVRRRAVNQKAIAALIEAGADLTIKNKEDQPASHFAMRLVLAQEYVRHYENRGTFSILKAGDAEDPVIVALINRGADVINSRDDRGQTLSMLAAGSGNLSIVSALCDAGANLNVQDNEGKTALMFAVDSGGSKTLALLLEKGADPGITDEEGRYAADYVSYSKNTMTIEHYLQLEAARERDNYWADHTANSFSGGDGTRETPYLIGSANELARLAYVVNDQIEDNDGKSFSVKHYRLISDIDLASHDWTPVGNGSSETAPVFGGRFEGGGHEISNLKIAYYPERVCVGLFGNIAKGAEITDVRIENMSIRGLFPEAFVGGFAGVNRGVLKNCAIRGVVSAFSGHMATGGIAGLNDGLVANCSSIVAIEATNAGGLVGWNRYGVIENSEANADIRAIRLSGGDDERKLGGLAGINNGVMRNCSGQGNIYTGRNGLHPVSWINAGSLAGYNDGGLSENCAGLSTIDGYRSHTNPIYGKSNQ
jgi:ankyrin repeat protein